MAENMEIQVEVQRRGARSNQKLKILYLAKILLENTDAEHDITLQEIIDKLSANNVTAERKSLYDDIAQLDDFGIKIKKTQYGKTYHYQVVNRDFEIAELKLLADSVASAKFITEKKSNELIKKIEHLASKHDASKLQRQVYVTGRVKSMNNDIMENVDAIHNAISQNLKISFQYFQWNIKKQPELRKGGARYVISPWGLSWEDENYYLVGYDSDADIAYGWDVAVYSSIEHIYGYDYVTSCYKDNPHDSWKQITDYMHEMYPRTTDKLIRKVLK